jgi:hypothetical protein
MRGAEYRYRPRLGKRFVADPEMDADSVSLIARVLGLRRFFNPISAIT